MGAETPAKDTPGAFGAGPWRWRWRSGRRLSG